MTTDEAFANIQQQNEIIISLLARLVWTPDKLAGVVMAKKKNPEAYVSVYNALDGVKTGKQLGEIAGVTQQSISAVLQAWLDEGIVLNVGTDVQPKYRRLMRLPERRKAKTKQEQEAESTQGPPGTQEIQETNANRGQY